jgi:hypothetical protein
MSDISQLSASPTQAAISRIADANHCQAGGVIGLSGALAAALAQACANACLSDGAQDEAADAARALQGVMSGARARFQAIADEDAQAITQFVELRNRGEALKGYELLCDGPRELADLAISAASAMQTYRPHVCERTRDDLEFALTLMTGVARAAMQLLDSNLRIWPLPELLATYEPHIRRLLSTLQTLSPVERIRKP